MNFGVFTICLNIREAGDPVRLRRGMRCYSIDYSLSATRGVNVV